MLALVATALALAAPACPPTRPDAFASFYVAGAPLRTKVGSGHILYGVVRKAYSCRPIPHARVEIWQPGPTGRYGPRWRATLVCDRGGRYRFEGPYPGRGAGRRPLIHLRVSAPGYQTLLTRYEPRPRERVGRLDLSLLAPP